jgi:hypothetical protein
VSCKPLYKGQVSDSFLIYCVSITSAILSELLADKIFLRLCISLIETAAIPIPPKINPRQKEAIIIGSILKTSEYEFYNYMP